MTYCQRCGEPTEELFMSIQQEEVCAGCLEQLSEPGLHQRLTDHQERRGLARVRAAILRTRGEDRPPTPPQGFA